VPVDMHVGVTGVEPHGVAWNLAGLQTALMRSNMVPVATLFPLRLHVVTEFNFPNYRSSNAPCAGFSSPAPQQG